MIIDRSLLEEANGGGNNELKVPDPTGKRLIANHPKGPSIMSNYQQSPKEFVLTPMRNPTSESAKRLKEASAAHQQ